MMKLKFVKVMVISCMIISSLYADLVRIPALERVRKKVDDALQQGATKLSAQIDKVRIGLGTNHDKLLDDAEKIMAHLKWSNQYEVVKTLLTFKEQSIGQAAQYLKEIIKTKYGGTRSPLVAFAHELAAEERKLQEVFNMLLKSVNGDKSRVKVLFDLHTRLSQNLQQLVDVSNALLMG